MTFTEWNQCTHNDFLISKNKNHSYGHSSKKERKRKLAESQSMTNQKRKLIIGHMGAIVNRDRT